MLFGKYHNSFVNYGLTDEEYEAIREDIVAQNSKNLNGLGIIAIILTIASGVFSLLFYDDLSWIMYFVCAFFIFLAWFFNRLFTKKNTRALKYFVYLLVLSFLIMGMISSLYFEGDKPAVSFICYLILLPFIFSDRPYRIVATVSFFMIIYLVLAFIFKDINIIKTDVINVVMFGTCTEIITIFLGKYRVKGFYDAYKVEVLAHHDVLTNVKNRNSFEEMLKAYPNLVEKSITCIYMDANGLHEINNTQGHEAGDKMLKTLADILKKYTGSHHTYRTGGDEFVGFLLDVDEKEALRVQNAIFDDVNLAGYHAAYGVVTESRENLDMAELVKKSELLMYSHKAEYYQDAKSKRVREFTFMNNENE